MGLSDNTGGKKPAEKWILLRKLYFTKNIPLIQHGVTPPLHELELRHSGRNGESKQTNKQQITNRERERDKHSLREMRSGLLYSFRFPKSSDNLEI